MRGEFDFSSLFTVLRPPDLKLFSASGCKRVAQKIDLLVEELEENIREEL